MAEIKENPNTETNDSEKSTGIKDNNDKKGGSKKNGRRRGGKGSDRSDSGQKPNGSGSARFNKMEMRNPALLSAVATYPFSYVAGLPTDMYNPRDIESTLPFDRAIMSEANNNKLITPGVCVCYVRPSLPVTDSSTSAVNVAFLQEYTFLRHTISASLPYEAADVALYYLAGAEVYSLINFLTRVYACAYMYTPQNRYTPEALIRVQGVDPSSVINNMAQCRASLNLLIERAAALPIPAKIPYIADRYSKFSDIYTEGTSIKDQLYMYSPEGFWIFGDTIGTGNKPGLKYEKKVGASIPQLSFQSWCNLGMEMLNGLFNSQTTGIIGANVRRAYGDNNLMLLAVVPEFITIAPTFNIGVLEQMANSDILDDYMRMTNDESGTYNLDTRWNVEQEIYNPGDPAFWIKFKPTLRMPRNGDQFRSRTSSEVAKFGNSGLIKDLPTYQGIASSMLSATMSHVLTTSTSETSPELVVESSRQMIVYNPLRNGEDDTYQEFGLVTQSSVIVDCILYTFDSKLSLVTSDHRVELPKYNQLNNMYGFRIRNMMLLADNSQFSTADAHLVSGTGWKSMNTTVAFWDSLRDTFEFAPKQFLVAGSIQSNGSFLMYTVIRQARDLDNFTILDATGLTKIHEVATLELFSIPGVASAY